jgi:hypothetical protein
MLKLVILMFQTSSDPESGINFSTYHRFKIGDLHLTHRPTCAAQTEVHGSIYVCLPEK